MGHTCFLIWGDWLSCDPPRGSHDSQSPPLNFIYNTLKLGGGPRVVVSTAAFHARGRGSVPGLGGLKETKNVSSPSTCES